MSMLGFFPWTTVAAPVSVGPFRLVPHRVGNSLEAEPRLVDAILAPYQEPGGGPVESATLVRVAGRAHTGDLDEEEQTRIYQLADAVAFAVLSRRGFFEVGPYWNRDQLAFVLRRFTGNDPRALQMVARRRDGRRWLAHGIGTFRTTRPAHAPRPPTLELDAPLAAALLAAFAAPGGTSIRASVAAFLAANGDGDGISTGEELHLMVLAFEQLLGPPGEGELPQRLLALLDPFVSRARAPRRLSTLQRLEASVELGTPPSSSIVEAWARDLLRARRGAPPGGGRSASYWPREAHLLVGAHLFPAAVLARLASAGLRPITEADRKPLLACAYLASLRNPFARRRSLAARNPHLWSRALEVAGRHLARIQLAEVLERSRRS